MFELFHLPDVFPKLNLLTPIGISFYTLQAVSYLTDVYNGKVTADENLGRVALFLSFFPIVMEGPICRYDQIAADVYAGRPLRYKNLESGFIRVLWGLFKKIVIADRLNVIVGETYWRKPIVVRLTRRAPYAKSSSGPEVMNPAPARRRFICAPYGYEAAPVCSRKASPASAAGATASVSIVRETDGSAGIFFFSTP